MRWPRPSREPERGGSISFEGKNAVWGRGGRTIAGFFLRAGKIQSISLGNSHPLASAGKVSSLPAMQSALPVRSHCAAPCPLESSTQVYSTRGSAVRRLSTFLRRSALPSTSRTFRFSITHPGSLEIATLPLPTAGMWVACRALPGDASDRACLPGLLRRLVEQRDVAGTACQRSVRATAASSAEMSPCGKQMPGAV